MIRSHFILYVADQALSTKFYSYVLNCEPALNVPGMTEFSLHPGCILGLMPAAGIQHLLGPKLPAPHPSSGMAHGELYLVVDDPQLYHRRALEAGALEISGLDLRGWGHRVAYSLDPDGYVLAFASVE